MSFDASLVGRFIHGEKRACARIISIIEDRRPGFEEYLEKLQPHTGRAHVIGITGPPGVGKSTLVNRLATILLSGSSGGIRRTVGVIAVDPSSPFSGGAILGDRIRMGEISTNPSFYFRSMSSRGSLGGLSEATGDAIRVLDAFGKEIILVETVGTGQNEVDIMESCDTTVVVLMPGAGDDIQAQKAGILEIGDIFVINKSDRDGAVRTASELSAMLEMNPEKTDYQAPILMARSNAGEGIAEIAAAIDNHAEYLRSGGKLHEKRSRRNFAALERIVGRKILAEVMSAARKLPQCAEIERSVTAGAIGPQAGSIKIMEYIKKIILNSGDRYEQHG